MEKDTVIIFKFPHEGLSLECLKCGIDERFSFFYAALQHGVFAFDIYGMSHFMFDLIFKFMHNGSAVEEKLTKAIRDMGLLTFIGFKQAVGYYGFDVLIEYCNVIEPSIIKNHVDGPVEARSNPFINKTPGTFGFGGNKEEVKSNGFDFHHVEDKLVPSDGWSDFSDHPRKKNDSFGNSSAKLYSGFIPK